MKGKTEKNEKGFTPPPEILQRVLGFKAIEHKDGKIFIWGLGGSFIPYPTTIFLLRLLEKEFGQEKAANIFYTIGKIQGAQTFELITKKFGYAKTIREKSNLLRFNQGQSDVAGNGHIEWKIIDFEKNFFSAKGATPYAQEYLKLFGLQKNGVDFFMVGQAAGIIESVTNKKMNAFETQCVACGKQFCEAIVFSSDKKSKFSKYPNYREFKEIDLNKLGSLIEPRLAYLH